MSSASSNGTWIVGDWVKVRRGCGTHGYRLHTHPGYGYDNYVAEVWQNSYGGWVGKAISPTGETRTSSRACGKSVLMRHCRQWALNQIVDLVTSKNDTKAEDK